MIVEMYVAVTLTPELDLCDNLGIYHTMSAARYECAQDADSLGQPITDWIEVTRVNDQRFQQAWESRPEPDLARARNTLYRIEKWKVWS